jgi:antitoxin component YwqK of YwqJK toxin-antitoxin module
MIKFTTKLFLLVFFISFYFHAQAQNVRKLADLQKQGEQLFWNGSPYTGEALDFDGVNFDNSKLRFSGYYVNGQPNGRIQKWFPNYKLEYEENYNMGKREGTQHYFYDSGKKKEEAVYKNGKANGTHKKWNEDGMLIYDFQMSGGEREGKCTEYHANGKLKKSGSYHIGIPTDTLIKEFDEAGKLVKEEITRENGRIKIFRNHDLEKITETWYENMFLTATGHYTLSMERNGEWKFSKPIPNSSSSRIYKSEKYLNGKLNGPSVEYNDDGSVAHTDYYKDGTLDPFTSRLVRYHISNSEQLLIGIPNIVNHQLAIVRITKPGSIFNSYFSKTAAVRNASPTKAHEETLLNSLMNNIIGHRGIFMINDYQLKQYADDTIFYDLSISTPFFTFSSQTVKYQNGSSGIGYCCTVSLMAILTDVNNKNAGTLNYTSSTCPQGTTSFTANSQFYPAKNDAFNSAMNAGLMFVPQAKAFSGQVLKFVYNSFQVCNQISSIDERDGKGLAKKITCNTNAYVGLPDNLRLDVFSEKNLNQGAFKIGTLKIKEVNSAGIKLKVDDGAERITEAFDNGEKLFIVSALY